MATTLTSLEELNKLRSQSQLGPVTQTQFDLSISQSGEHCFAGQCFTIGTTEAITQPTTEAIAEPTVESTPTTEAIQTIAPPPVTEPIITTPTTTGDPNTVSFGPRSGGEAFTDIGVTKLFSGQIVQFGETGDFYILADDGRTLLRIDEASFTRNFDFDGTLSQFSHSFGEATKDRFLFGGDFIGVTPEEQIASAQTSQELFNILEESFKGAPIKFVGSDTQFIRVIGEEGFNILQPLLSLDELRRAETEGPVTRGLVELPARFRDDGTFQIGPAFFGTDETVDVDLEISPDLPSDIVDTGNIITNEDIASLIKDLKADIPEAVDFSELFTTLRSEKGIPAIEAKIVSLNTDIADAEANLRIVEAEIANKQVSTRVISREQAEQRRIAQEQIDFFTRQKNTAINELNVKNAAIAQVMELEQLDFQNANDLFSTRFNRALELIAFVQDYKTEADKLKNDEQDRALANWQVLASVYESNGLTWDTLSPEQQAGIESLAIKAGFPGLSQFIGAGKGEIQSINKITNKDTGQVSYDIVRRFPDGSISVESTAGGFVGGVTPTPTIIGGDTITAEVAEAQGLPPSLVGKTEDDVLKDLDSEEPVQWFIELVNAIESDDAKRENRDPRVISPEEIKARWDEFRVELRVSFLAIQEEGGETTTTEGRSAFE